MQTHSSPLDNRLLASLGSADWLRLQPHVDRVVLNRKESVYEPGQTLSHAYFPTTLLASLMHVTEDGDCAESALVGNDGMLGVSLFMSGTPSSGYASVLASGEAYQAQLAAAGYGPITTEIVYPAPTYYYAEDYHQQYLAKNPNGYCGIGGTGVACSVGIL